MQATEFEPICLPVLGLSWMLLVVTKRCFLSKVSLSSSHQIKQVMILQIVSEDHSHEFESTVLCFWIISSKFKSKDLRAAEARESWDFTLERKQLGIKDAFLGHLENCCFFLFLIVS